MDEFETKRREIYFTRDLKISNDNAEIVSARFRDYLPGDEWKNIHREKLAHVQKLLQKW